MAQFPSANISRVGTPANALRDHYACAYAATATPLCRLPPCGPANPVSRIRPRNHVEQVVRSETFQLVSLFAGRAWIDALDPLFAKLSDAYMKILIEDFGTDHIYAADGAPKTFADVLHFGCHLVAKVELLALDTRRYILARCGAVDERCGSEGCGGRSAAGAAAAARCAHRCETHVT